LYLSWISYLGDRPDAISSAVAEAGRLILSIYGFPVLLHAAPGAAKIYFSYAGHPIIAVSEGCNGVSLLIIFASLIIAFEGTFFSKALFTLSGAILIFTLNVLRIVLLFMIARSGKQLFNLFHEYIFTAIIYMAVFLLFIYRVRTYDRTAGSPNAPS
jgi:exosortase family protein XrtF